MIRRIARLPEITDDERREIETARAKLRESVPPRALRTRRSRGTPRARTIARKNITRAMLAAEAFVTTLVPDEVLASRPRTRDDCRRGDNAERPCPWVACRHHLYLDINPQTGSIKLNFPTLEPWELAHTCALDVAELGGITLEEIGVITNLTRERIRQLEVRGLLKLKQTRVVRSAAS